MGLPRLDIAIKRLPNVRIAVRRQLLPCNVTGRKLVSSVNKDAAKCNGLPVLEMFTKDNCSLCEQAKNKLKEYENLLTLKEINITLPENKMWFDKYKYDIPVFHFNGGYLMRHKVHEGLLKKVLNNMKTYNKK